MTMSIAEIPLFAGLGESARAALRSAFFLREYNAGDVILAAGQAGESLFVIVAGTVSVQSGSRRPPVLLGAGEIFGEMSLISCTPVSATVVAVRETR